VQHFAQLKDKPAYLNKLSGVQWLSLYQVSYVWCAGPQCNQ